MQKDGVHWELVLGREGSGGGVKGACKGGRNNWGGLLVTENNIFFYSKLPPTAFFCAGRMEVILCYFPALRVAGGPLLLPRPWTAVRMFEPFFPASWKQVRAVVFEVWGI